MEIPAQWMLGIKILFVIAGAVVIAFPLWMLFTVIIHGTQQIPGVIFAIEGAGVMFQWYLLNHFTISNNRPWLCIGCLAIALIEYACAFFITYDHMKAKLEGLDLLTWLIMSAHGVVGFIAVVQIIAIIKKQLS